MKRSDAEQLARRGAYVSDNPLGGVDIELPNNVQAGPWDLFQYEFDEVIGPPRYSNDTAVFPIRAKYGQDEYGYVACSRLEHIVVMNTLYVYPHLRGRGVGRRVLTALAAKGPPLLARICPFVLRSKSSCWNVEVEPTSYPDNDDVVLSEQPEKFDSLMKLYESCGWKPALVASSPKKKWATTLDVTLPGFIHLIEGEVVVSNGTTD